MILVELGNLSLEVAYVDGTKIESRANRYRFVWRKTVEKTSQNLKKKSVKYWNTSKKASHRTIFPTTIPPRPSTPKN
jgi:hypothetical protein